MSYLLFVHAQPSMANIPNSSQVSKLPINDMLTKFVVCAFLDKLDNTLKDGIFIDGGFFKDDEGYTVEHVIKPFPKTVLCLG